MDTITRTADNELEITINGYVVTTNKQGRTLLSAIGYLAFKNQPTRRIETHAKLKALLSTIRPVNNTEYLVMYIYCPDSLSLDQQKSLSANAPDPVSLARDIERITGMVFPVANYEEARSNHCLHKGTQLAMRQAIAKRILKNEPWPRTGFITPGSTVTGKVVQVLDNGLLLVERGQRHDA